MTIKIKYKKKKISEFTFIGLCFIASILISFALVYRVFQ